MEGHQNINGYNIYYKDYDVEQSEACIVFLHGMRFSSQTWEDINTLQFVQESKIRAFAIDLPGYGKSEKKDISDRIEFMKELLDQISQEKKIIVSPSLSGMYALPYIEKYGDKLSGYIPVAPIDVDKFRPSENIKDNLNVFAVYGEKDPMMKTDLSVFEGMFKNFDKLIIENGSHPAYLDNPKLFNNKIVEFVKAL